MVTGPRDTMGAPAGGHSGMRASDADREQVVDALKAAFVQERLARDELDARVGRAFAARTYAELAAVTADIPAAPPPAPPPVREQAEPRGGPSVKKLAITCACGVLAAELILFLAVLAVPIYGTLDFAVLANLAGLPLVGGKVLDTWRENHSRGQRPPRPALPALPAQRRPALEGGQGGTIGSDLTYREVRRGVRGRTHLRLTSRTAAGGPATGRQRGLEPVDNG